MLQPFKVRDLASQTANANLHAVASAESTSQDTAAKYTEIETIHDVRGDERHGVVVLSASEYDHIISTHPRAALMYMDPDDGETITVGSSLELSQRLEDPVFDSTLPWASPPSPGPSSSQDDQNPMHIFDIRRSNSVTELWKRYERSNRFPEQSSSQETSLEDVSESKPSKPVFGDASTVDIRQRWLRACNPPQVPKREPSPRKQQEQAPLFSFSSAQVSDAASSSMPANTDYTGEKVASQESGTSFLTAEGKRQAQEAGARMRGWRQTPDASTSRFISLPSIQGDPWVPGASMNCSTNASMRASSRPEATPNTEPPAGDEAQPLLAAFEAEMSRIMEAHTDAEREGPGASISTPVETQGAQQPSDATRPADLFVHAMNNVIGKVELVGSELRARLPEIERQVSSAQRAFPEQIRPTLQNALSALDGCVKNLAYSLGEASIASGNPANRVRTPEFPQAEQAVNDFRELASEFSQIGRTLFESFRTEFGPSFSSGATQESSAEAISASTQTDTAVPDVDSQPGSTVSSAVSETQGQHETSGPSSFSKGKERVADITDDTHKEVFDRESSQTETDEGAATFGQPPLSLQGASYPHIGFSTWQLPTVPPFGRPGNLPIPHDPYPPPPPPPPQSDSQAASSLQTSSQAPASEQETLFIGNVGYNVTDKVIQDVFASKGFLVKVDLPVDLESGRHAGFGYLHFPSVHSAKAALAALQGAHIDGHSINLEFCHGALHNFKDNAASLSGATERPLGLLNPRSQSSYPQVKDSFSKKVCTAGTPSAMAKCQNISTLQGSSMNDTGVSMLDEAVVDPEFSARYPSLLSGGPGVGAADTPSPGKLAELNTKARIPEFPPVSQVDAHVLRTSHRLSHPTPCAHINMSEARQNQDGNPHPALVDTGDVPVASTDEQPVSLPRRSPHHRGRRPMSMREPYDQYGGASLPRRVPHGPHRSNTVTTAGPARRPLEPSNHMINPEMLPRHWQSARSAACAPDTNDPRWIRHARLTERQNDQGPHRQTSLNEISRTSSGFPVDDIHNHNEGSRSGPRSDTRRRHITGCVETLLELGYGSMRGGRQRMTIYAEAADGKIQDAIDMIEEERKAYEQQGSLI
ncbi:hypothetical protein DTO166G4_4558 [Paecilomyces variotii]|nr:hypothetical protein DTO166G4_4558 [Paecilomyces variotii]KAJ9235553.1 hypothetical protein DTO166G5_4575 [Paecilomyces variotii]